MSARTKRALYRLLAAFLAAGAGDAIAQWASTGFYDYRHLAGALVVSAVLAAEQVLKSSDPVTASPSVLAVDTALENRAATVPRPNIAIPPDPIVRTLDTL